MYVLLVQINIIFRIKILLRTKTYLGPFRTKRQTKKEKMLFNYNVVVKTKSACLSKNLKSGFELDEVRVRTVLDEHANFSAINS